MNGAVSANIGTRIMGILNVTPDSFSDGGLYHTIDTAIARGRQLVAQGAQLVDIGGESTRPGAIPVPPDDEQRRILDVIRALADDGIVVSVDTLHASTARAAVLAGAQIINDVSGGLHDPEMLEVIAETGALCILGHWRGVPDPAHMRSDYDDVVADVRVALSECADAAERAGIAKSQIVLDPGLGFDKTGAQSWALLRELSALTDLGYPVMIGASRKRMLAEILHRLDAARQLPHAEPHSPRDRDLMTAVVSALAAQAGVWGVRVHDVPGSVQALAVLEAWQEAGS